MTIKHITVQQAHQQQVAGATYLDVRSIPEFQQGHPQGAFNVPLLHLDPETGQMRPNPEFLAVVKANFPRQAPMVVGCKMGGRSQQACEILASAGFEDVTTFYYLYQDDRQQRWGNGGIYGNHDRFERQAITQRVGVSYR